MSALCSKADSCNAAILSLFDYLIGADKQPKRRVLSTKTSKFDAVQQRMPQF
jgi:hypothetical protein